MNLTNALFEINGRLQNDFIDNVPEYKEALEIASMCIQKQIDLLELLQTLEDYRGCSFNDVIPMLEDLKIDLERKE